MPGNQREIDMTRNESKHPPEGTGKAAVPVAPADPRPDWFASRPIAAPPAPQPAEPTSVADILASTPWTPEHCRNYPRRASEEIAFLRTQLAAQAVPASALPNHQPLSDERIVALRDRANDEAMRTGVAPSIAFARAIESELTPSALPEGWALETGTGGFGEKGDRWVCVRHLESQCGQDFYAERGPLIFGFLAALAATPKPPQPEEVAASVAVL